MLRSRSMTRRLLGASLCTGLLSVSVSSAHAQDPLGAVNPPKGGTVRTSKDPLRKRSATDNVVFGQIVNIDEHRLTLREGEGDSATETIYRLSPDVRVYSGEREMKLSDMPADSRIRFRRMPDTNSVITELYAVEGDDAASAGDDETIEVVTSQSPVGFGLVLTTESDTISVLDVRAGSPAAKAGVKVGDQLVRLDDAVLVKPEDVFDATARMKVDDLATLTVRRDKEEMTVSMLAADGDEARDSIQAGSAPRPTRVVTEGDAPVVSTEVVPPVELGATLETTQQGVAVVRVDQVSPLTDAGVLPGDYIKQAAGQGVATPEGLFRILNKFDGGATVELNVVRNDTPMDFSLTLPEGHEKVLVETSANTVPRRPEDRTRSMRMRANDNEELLRQILQNQQRQQAQLNYLNEALQRLASASGVDGGILGAAPFGFGLGNGLGDGNSGCYCAIGFNPQGNPVVGFLDDGTAIAVVSYTADGTPILAATTLGSREGGPADGLTDKDQNGDGRPDGPDSSSAANANAGADGNCVCPIGVDVNGNPIVGVTQRGVPVAVISTNANGNPILAETQFGSNNPTGDQPIADPTNPTNPGDPTEGANGDDETPNRGVGVPVRPREYEFYNRNNPANRRGNNPGATRTPAANQPQVPATNQP